MEANCSSSSSATQKASSIRWGILRRALLRRPSPSTDEQSEMSIRRISRKTNHGFNLIPYHLVESHNEENSDSFSKANHLGSSSRDIRICYTLPIDSAPKIFLNQRVDDRADLHDFEICNRFNIDNTGLVCHWPSEDVLAYYCMVHTENFRFLAQYHISIRCLTTQPLFLRSKKVIELGSGYGLAGLVMAVVTEALEVVISDGNPQVVDYIQCNIKANSTTFGGTRVKSMMLHWNQEEISDISNTFDVIVASDCTFFKEFHKGLVQTVNFLLKNEGPSEAIFFSPKRGDSLDEFLLEVKESGLHFGITEIYDPEVWRRHQAFVNSDDSWPNYEKDHCYPLLIRITR
ncbi:unnamed protein product [Ilex paraguariensis]|uniref:Calmodulin-lysine N-methyltransferase n=1 Tax=Ilex paraguariensis TaxID=185542 RepID=A0ABC8SQT0_9AQUA